MQLFWLKWSETESHLVIRFNWETEKQCDYLPQVHHRNQNAFAVHDILQIRLLAANVSGAPSAALFLCGDRIWLRDRPPSKKSSSLISCLVLNLLSKNVPVGRGLCYEFGAWAQLWRRLCLSIPSPPVVAFAATRIPIKILTNVVWKLVDVQGMIHGSWISTRVWFRLPRILNYDVINIYS